MRAEVYVCKECGTVRLIDVRKKDAKAVGRSCTGCGRKQPERVGTTDIDISMHRI